MTNDNRRPARATAPAAPANQNTPLLTIDRAIADGLCPTSLRQVAAANDRKSARRQAVADNLLRIADKLELLGFGRGAGKKVAA